jgi:hypothetical protein
MARTSAFLAPWDGANFSIQALNHLSHGQPFAAAIVMSPTFVPDVVRVCPDLLIDKSPVSGIRPMRRRLLARILQTGLLYGRGQHGYA